MILDLLSGSYQAKYRSANTQRAVNWYVHKIKTDTQHDKFKQSWYPTPGLTVFTDTEETALFGSFVAHTLTGERAFVVADNVLYELNTDNTKTSRGTMTDMTPNSRVFFEINAENQMMIAHYSASYYLDLDTNVLTKITDADFPSAVDWLTYLNGRFIVCSGGRVYYSDLNNAASWNALNVFTPEARADKTIACIAWRDDLYCFGSETLEIYIDDGVTPFIKQPKSTVYVGVVAQETITVFKDGFFFLGKPSYGQQEVYYYNGQELFPISPSINWAINIPDLTGSILWDNLLAFTWDQWFTTWDAGVATSYATLQQNKEGHTSYFLTIPFLNTTYVYDLVSKEWTERASEHPAGTGQSAFRGKYHINFNGYDLWTDLYSGKVFYENYAISTEDGLPITRTGVTGILSDENKNISIYTFEIDCTAGTGLINAPETPATILLYISRDGGNTYLSPRTLSLGASGQYTTRVQTTKLGTARNWVFKIVLTDAADISINNIIIHGVTGSY